MNRQEVRSFFLRSSRIAATTARGAFSDDESRQSSGSARSPVDFTLVSRSFHYCRYTHLLGSPLAIRDFEEDSMTYQFPRYPDSPVAARRPGTGGSSTRSEHAWALADFLPVVLFSALGLVAALYLGGREASPTAEKGTSPVAARENVLPALVISPLSLEPNLNGVLATGDGAASIPLEELVAGVRREAFDRNLVHARVQASDPTR
jgi:hypothetical protein